MLGKLIPAGYPQDRDAIHVAVAPVVAAHELYPGTHVGWYDQNLNAVGTHLGDEVLPDDQLLGIVDPYLRAMVQPGERFWLFLYPLSITSLKHQWTHPAFPDPAPPPSISTQPSASPSEPGHWQWMPLSVEANDAKHASMEWLEHWAQTKDVDVEEFLQLVVENEHGSQHDWITFGTDAYGSIDDGDPVWHHVEVVTGVPMTAKPTTFHCAC